MSDDAPSTALTVQPQRALRTPVEDLLPVYDSARFDHMGRIASVMAKASLVPDTLKGNGYEEAAANCFQVVELADRWGYSPFAVAQCASVVHGKLMLEGKLVAAVLESKLGIELNHYYTGEWGQDDYRIFVTDTDLTAEQIAGLKPHIKMPGIKIIDGSVGEWKTKEKNGATKGNWISQPDMQLQYRGDRTWAKAFKSAIMLGVLTEDDMDAFSDRQESRRPSLSAGPDLAALENARQSMVAAPEKQSAATVVVQPDPPTKGEDQTQSPEATAEESHVEPDPGHAEDAAQTTAPHGEVYLLAGEPVGDDGKFPTYKDGKPFSRASEKAAGRLKAYDLHTPVQESGEAERPTPTASAPTAEAGPATSASAKPASDPSPGPVVSGPESLASGSESSTEAIFSDIDDPNPGEINELEPVDPLIAAMTELNGANSGREIKDIMGRTSASEAFKSADDNGRMLVRQAAWDRYSELHNRGVEDGRVTLDVMFMSLWIEFGATTKLQVDQMWAAFFQGDVYKGLNDGWKRALAALITKRKAVLP